MSRSTSLRPGFVHLLAVAIVAVCSHSSIAVAKLWCPPGTFVYRSGGATRCVKCRPGTYAVVPNSPKCTLCPANTYSFALGLRVRRACFPCPPGSVSKPGSTKCTFCPPGHVQLCFRNRKCLRCNPGTYLNIYSCKCERCRRGDVTRSHNELFCISDFDRSTGLAPGDQYGDMSISRVKQTCPTGYGEEDERDCEICGYNRFRARGMKECEECPFGTVTPNWDEPSTRCESCPPGRYITDLTPHTVTNEQVPYCAACPRGWTTTQAGRALCHPEFDPPFGGLRCPADAFETAEGDCHVCNINSRYDPETRQCLRCPRDAVSSGGVSTRCTKCRPGEVAVVVRGQQSDSCECPGNAQLIAHRDGRVTCTPCPAGSLSVDGKCKPCPAGEFVRRDGRDFTCSRCQPSRPVVWRGRCVSKLPSCRSGFLRAPRGVEKYMRAGTCVSVITGCPAGTRLERVPSGKLFCMSGEGENRRVVCPDDEMELYNGRDACVSCPVNSALVQIDGVWKCSKCKTGTVSPGGKAKRCRTCMDGLRPSEDVPGSCACPPGWYVSRRDGGKCVPCPPYRSNDSEGMTTCRSCGRGFTASCECRAGRVVNVEGDCVVDLFRGPEYTDG